MNTSGGIPQRFKLPELSLLARQALKFARQYGYVYFFRRAAGAPAPRRKIAGPLAGYFDGDTLGELIIHDWLQRTECYEGTAGTVWVYVLTPTGARAAREATSS